MFSALGVLSGTVVVSGAGEGSGVTDGAAGVVKIISAAGDGEITEEP